MHVIIRFFLLFVTFETGLCIGDILDVTGSLKPIGNVATSATGAIKRTVLNPVNVVPSMGGDSPNLNCGRHPSQYVDTWPWHVALYMVKSSTSGRNYICGGTLLSENFVITAGHCVMERDAVIIPERLFVIAGKSNLDDNDDNSQERSVLDIITHPEYSSTYLKNDIALIRLKENFTLSAYVQPICLWRDNKNKNDIVNKLGTVVGWGLDEDKVARSNLMTSVMPVHKDADCINANSNFYSKYLTDYTYCAGYSNGTSLCNGSSGGGMYFSKKEKSEDVWYIRGIVSLTVSKPNRNVCDSNYYTIFTDIAKYLDFIKNA